MPRFLQVLFVVFLAMPVLSWFTVGSPMVLLANGATPLAIAAVFAYWVGPLALSGAIYFRAHTVAFVFMAECTALLAHAALAAQASTNAALSMTRIALIACIAVLGLAFVHRDVSMPFFSGKKRGFRGASRLRVNAALKLKTAAGLEIASEMEDCSLIGMSLALGANPEVDRGDRVNVAIRLEKTTYNVDAKVEWCVRDEPFYRVGVSTTDVTLMERIIKDVTLRAVPGYQSSVLKLLTRTSISRAALAMWLVSFAGVAGVPACGESKPEKRPKTAESKNATKKKPIAAVEVGGRDGGAASKIPAGDLVTEQPPQDISATDVANGEAASCTIEVDPPDVKAGDIAKVQMKTSGTVRTAVLDGKSIKPEGLTVDVKVDQPMVFTGSVSGVGSNVCSGAVSVGGEKSDAGLPPSCTLDVNPKTASAGDQIVLTVHGENATKALINGEKADISGGSVKIAALRSAVYQAMVINDAGESATCSSPLAVGDLPPPPAPPACVLTTSDRVAEAGAPVTITMITTGDVDTAFVGDVALKDGGGSITQKLKRSKVFSGYVSGLGGFGSCAVAVTVAGDSPPPPIASCMLVATPAAVAAGQAVTLSMVATNAKSVDQPGKSAGAGKPFQDSPASTTTYTGVARNIDGVAAPCAAMVVVDNAPPKSAACELSVLPESVEAGGGVFLTVKATDSAQTTIQGQLVAAAGGNIPVVATTPPEQEFTGRVRGTDGELHTCTAALRVTGDAEDGSGDPALADDGGAAEGGDGTTAGGMAGTAGGATGTAAGTAGNAGGTAGTAGGTAGTDGGTAGTAGGATAGGATAGTATTANKNLRFDLSDVCTKGADCDARIGQGAKLCSAVKQIGAAIDETACVLGLTCVRDTCDGKAAADCLRSMFGCTDITKAQAGIHLEFAGVCLEGTTCVTPNLTPPRIKCRDAIIATAGTTGLDGAECKVDGQTCVNFAKCFGPGGATCAAGSFRKMYRCQKTVSDAGTLDFNNFCTAGADCGQMPVCEEVFTDGQPFDGHACNAATQPRCRVRACIDKADPATCGAESIFRVFRCAPAPT